MTDRKGAVATQRLFFALWPDSALQQQLAQTALALLPGADVRRVPSENLHSTLVFLGNVDPAQRLCLEDAANLVRAQRFTLTLNRFGYFRRPQVAWLGCTTIPAPLRALVAELSLGAAACGFPPDKRPYEPHLSIARHLRSDPGRLAVIPISWDVEHFVLMESVSDANGVRYSPLRFWPL